LAKKAHKSKAFTVGNLGAKNDQEKTKLSPLVSLAKNAQNKKLLPLVTLTKNDQEKTKTFTVCILGQK